MGAEVSPDVRQIRMRANPEYELVVLDRLSSDERQVFAGLNGHSDCYGVLRPHRDSELSFKAVSRDTALLLLTLNQPMMLPQYAIREMGEECDSVVGAMIADGILEVELDGRMLSGPVAYHAIFGEPVLREPAGVLPALSWQAIEYADTLEIYDVEILAARLYAYNCLPITAAWRRRLPDTAAVESYLGLNEAGVASLLDREWLREPQEVTNPAWISFRSLSQRAPSGEVHKVYVSPLCEVLAEVIDAVVPVLTRLKVFHWKVGCDVRGLLRPDKIVIYLCDSSALQALASVLRELLSGCPAQGVPFTAEIAPSGVLSWGVDPAIEESNGLPWLQRESWRMRICRRLASALCAGKRARDHVTPARFALERLRLEGIDTGTWTPRK